MDPDKKIDEDDSCEYDMNCQRKETHEELAEWNDSWAASNDDGWFYSDAD